MRTFNVILLFLFFAVSGYCQNIEGTIKNQEGDYLEGITVTLNDKSSASIISFSRSDKNGKYLMQIPQGYLGINNTIIQVQSLGYKKESLLFKVGQFSYNFIIAVEEIALPDVVIKSAKQNVSVRRDTTSYIVSDFSREQDRNIGDVLKRMPGVEVDRTGKIFYNGKPISKFYIDSDNLLDDKYNIGTNSIPNGIVDRVQILENHEPVKMRRETSASTATALNITLKDNNNKPVNQLKLGGGFKKTYEGELTSMFFRKRFKAMDQFKLNNNGADYSADLISHDSQSIQNRLGIGSIDPLLSASVVKYPAIEPSIYLYNRSGLLNANNLFKLRNEWQLKFKTSYLYDRQLQNFQNLTQIFLNHTDTIQYSERLNNVLKPQEFVAEFNLNANKENYYLDNTIKFNHSRTRNNADMLINGFPVDQLLKTKIVMFSNEFITIKKLEDSKSLEFLSYLSTYKFPQQLTVSPGTFPATFGIPAQVSFIEQNLNIPSFYTKNHVALTIPGIISQTYTLGLTSQSQKLESNLLAIPLDSVQPQRPSNSMNDLTWYRYNIYTEAAFNYKSQDKKIIINMKLPAGVLKTKYYNFSSTEPLLKSQFVFSPLLRFTFEPSISNQLNISYVRSIDPGNIENFYSGNILTGYRRLQSYDNSYWQDKQTFEFNYTYRQPAELLFVNAGASYTLRGSRQIPVNELNNNFSLVQFILSNYFQNSTFEVHTGLSKFFFSLNTTAGIHYSFQVARINQFFNAGFLPYKNRLNTLSLTSDTQVDKKTFIKYSGDLLYFINMPSDKNSLVMPQPATILNQQLEFSYLPLENLSIKVSGSHLYNRSRQFASQNNVFVNASAQYVFKKPRVDLQFTAVNLANIKSMTMTNLDANTTFTTSYPLRGFLGMIKATIAL